MKNGSIFALVKIQTNLFSIQYDKDEPHIFKKIFDEWNDVEYLDIFFEEHYNDLQNDFWQSSNRAPISIEEAIEITIQRASQLEAAILSSDLNDNLDHLFKPLSKYPFLSLPKKILTNRAFKAYGENRPSWLRIYAIKLETAYIITGGAIKLTRTMEDKSHTNIELNKLMNVLGFLKNHDIDCSDMLYDPDTFISDSYIFEI